MDSGQENSKWISIDLINEILSRLPGKSIARFRCVSKQWGSMLSRPRLLLALERANGELLFFSSHQPHNRYEKSSLVVKADFHMKFSQDMKPDFRAGLTSGLIYFSGMSISKEAGDTVPMIYNPSTGQYVTLPKLKRYKKSYSFLGFDPIDEQFKVLFVAYPYCLDDHRILEIGTGKRIWRKIVSGLTHEPLCEGICITGVLYYLAEVVKENNPTYQNSYVIVCFDVRYEKFEFVDAECFCDPYTTKLINYKGKIGGIHLTYDDTDAIKLCVWVLEDVGKQEWLSYQYTLPESQVRVYNVFVVGMTTTGDIVLSEKYTSKPFYVFCFNPEKNTLQSVEIQGVGEYHKAFDTECKVYAFVDYVVDSKSINMNGRNTSTLWPRIKSWFTMFASLG